MPPTRPSWCPHPDCIFLAAVGCGVICGGRLPAPVEHGGDFNTHRFCMNDGDDVGDYQVNKSDLWWLGLLFERLREDMEKKEAVS